MTRRAATSCSSSAVKSSSRQRAPRKLRSAGVCSAKSCSAATLLMVTKEYAAPWLLFSEVVTFSRDNGFVAICGVLRPRKTTAKKPEVSPADIPRSPCRRPCPRLRRGHGHHAVRQGLLPERLLRRAEPQAATARAGSARGVRARRRGDPRDEHLRGQPAQAQQLRAGGRDGKDQPHGGRAGAGRGRRQGERRGRG